MTDDESQRLTRRAALTAAVAGTASLAGCPLGSGPDDDRSTEEPPATDEPTQEPTEDEPTAPPRFETTVNVAEAGAATDASEPMTDVILEHAADDTQLVFPEGRYLVDPIVLSDLENFAMRAAPNADPTLIPAGPASDLGKWFVQLTNVDRLLFENFIFDFSTAGHGGMTYVLGTGEFTVRNVHVKGPVPADTSAFRFEVVSRDSHGLVQNLVAKDGSEPESSSVGIYVGSDHGGTLTFRNCDVWNFPNNGLYASSPGREDAGAGANGPVHVEGGSYRNNNIANVRLGSNGSYVRDAEIVIDEVPPALRGEVNARGVRFRARGGHLVENCDIRIDHPDVSSFGGVVVHPASRNVRVRNSTISVESRDVPAVNLLEPRVADRASVFENVEVSGAAAGGDAVRIVNRNGTSFQRCTIDQPGEQRNGLHFDRSQECAVTDSSISATAEPIVSVDSTVTTTDTELLDLSERGESTDDGDSDAAGDATGDGDRA